MKKIINYILYTKWKPIRYYWPYPEGYGIYRKNRWSGQMTVVDRYHTKQEALEAAKNQNAIN